MNEALKAWHEEADRLKKCLDYAPTGGDEYTFRTLLAKHLHTKPIETSTKPSPAPIDLSDVIHNPTDYLVDGKPILRAYMLVYNDDSRYDWVKIHQYDYNNQIKRITRNEKATRTYQP